MPYHPKFGNFASNLAKEASSKLSEIKDYVLPPSNTHTVASKPMTDSGKKGGICK